MAPRQTRRLSNDEIDADRTALLALKDIGDYAPLNAAYSVAALTALGERLAQAEQAKMRAQNALDAARDAAVAAAWDLHEAMLGVKAQVIAQYGHDSYQVQAL